MSKKIQVKLILQLRAAGLSQRMIAASHHMSKTSVGEVFRIAEERGISYDGICEKRPDEVYRLFFPDKVETETVFKDPDYVYVHSELSRTGVTLKLLWKEYRDRCSTEKLLPMGYSKFCAGYGDYTVASKLTSHLQHKPGVVSEVDWSGSKMTLVDRTTGEVIPIHLFVATLPYSQYTYVEPCLNMKQDTWLRCHVHMFEFWGGTSIRIVCDNLKTGVIAHPREGDIVLNEAYEALGSHYSAAIMPANVRKPKQKASVEGAVGKIATAIIARLRNETFYTLDDLKSAITKTLRDFNDEAFQKRSGSRTIIFQNEEKAFLRELPAIPYELAQWYYGRKANLDSHIAFKNNHYSCPYQFVGKELDLKVTDTLIEIYCGNERVSSHRRFPDYMTNRWSTHPEDMPDKFQQPEWDDARILKWAASIGTSTLMVMDRIFSGLQIKEQGYSACLAVLRLSKSYTKERLEISCELALTKMRSPRYRHLKAILDANQDVIYTQTKTATNRTDIADSIGYVRGAAYYGGGGND